MIPLTFPEFQYRLYIPIFFVSLFQLGFSQVSEGLSSVRLVWNANKEANLEGYEVVYGITSSVYTGSVKVGPTPSAEIPNLSPGQNYFFAVKAINSAKASSGLSPEISFRVPPLLTGEIAVQTAGGADLASGVARLNFDGGSGVTQRLTVRNPSTAALSRLAITIDGVDASSFAVASAFPARLSALQNGGFEFGQSAWNLSGNAVPIARDNSVEGRNQLEFNGGDLTPNGVAVQNFPSVPGVSYTLTYEVGVLSFNTGLQRLETKVRGNGNLISEIVEVRGPDAGLTSWQTRSLTFTANSMNSELSFTDLSLESNRIDLLVDNVKVVAGRVPNLTQRTPIVTSLAANTLATLDVSYIPLTAGAKTAVLRIASDDLDENPFIINLNGAVGLTQPEIALISPENADLSSGANATGFRVGAAASRIYTIRNTGSAALTGLALSLTGADASQFSTLELRAATVAPGGNTTFKVNFNPTSPGVKTAVLRLANNDADENPFLLNLTGGDPLVLPEIAVDWNNGTEITSNSGITLYSTTNVGNTSPSVTYRIRNLGQSSLVGIAISVSDTQFVLPDFTTSTLAPGATASFAVGFRPTSSGMKNAKIQITSNDADENPFVINVRGEGIVPAPPALTFPEIAVDWNNGAEITSNSDITNYPVTAVGATSALVTYRIRNLGQSSLTGLVLSVTDAQFILPNFPTSTLAPGATASFSVGFRPTSAGPKNAKLQITSNDADENPFVINVRGAGIVQVPEIAVRLASGQDILTAAYTAAFGATYTGGTTAPQIFTIQNTGNAPLSGLNLSGPSDQFTIINPASVSLAPGASATFSVAFKPTSAGLKSGTLLLASNDADENPFRISLTGVGLLSSPEIAVQLADRTELVSDSSISNFGASQVGAATAPRVYTIQNLGTAALVGLAVTSSSADFELTSPLVGALPPGGSTTFSARFKPASGGSKSATLRIASNDANENPFIINMLGSGIAGVPRILVKLGDGVELNDGSRFDFGNVGMRQSLGRVITVTNLGNAPLAGLSTFYTGQKQFFNVSGFPVTSINPGESTTFTISASPSSLGNKSAVAFIYSNDPTHSTLRIELGVSGVLAPEIAVIAQNDHDLTDGQSAVPFGNLVVGQSGNAMEFTLRNVGSLALSQLSRSVIGAHAGDFSVSAFKSSSLAAGRSSTFTVVFKPGAVGLRTATLSLSSNDKDENPFRIHLTGNGNSALLNQPAIAAVAAAKLANPPIPEPAPVGPGLLAGQTTLGGQQFRTLTLSWSASAPRAGSAVIEVSSNLVDWFSGSNFTETLIDTGSILQVRDRTPFTSIRNRYIRLKPTPQADAALR